MIKLFQPPRQFFASEAMAKVANSDVLTLLDVGSGTGEQAQWFREAAGKLVTTISVKPPADFVGMFKDFRATGRYDCVWLSHVLEHVVDVGRTLSQCQLLLKDNGVLAVTVPPLKHEVVGGHVNLFNAGTLVYNLVLAGFDCSQAQVSPTYVGGVSFPYNISVVVRKRTFLLPKTLEFDAGDIERLAKWFPTPVAQGFNGDGYSVNWEKPI